VLPLLAIVLAVVAAAPAKASREPTGSEAKAIKKAFLKGREGKTTIRKIRVSTADTRFAAVFYKVQIEELNSSPPPPRTGTTRGAVKTYTPPAPEILKERKGSKWKTVPKVPKKVKKALKLKDPRSSIRITGEHTAFLTQPARCTDDGDFYSASVYDAGSDTYLSIEFHGDYYKGHGRYPALGVGSLAGLYGNSGTVLVYETGQGNDALSPSGDIWVDEGFGIIEASMARIPDEGGTYPQTVWVSGTWACG
jgi:hypothetical protein